MCALAALPAGAQTGWGLEAGGGIATMKFVPPWPFMLNSSSSVPAYRIGGVAEAAFTTRMFFQTGLYLAAKGHDRNTSYWASDSLNETSTQKLRLNYAEVPLHMMFKTGVPGRGRACVGAGVTFSYLLWGKYTVNATGKYNDTPYVVNVTIPTEKDEPLRSLDVSASFFAGYELRQGIFIRAFGTVGIKDLGTGNDINKNRMWGLSAGYMINNGKKYKKEKDDLIEP